ncbi:MAG: hypothetical protein K2G70_04145 [Turicibacter sp.]|nr:hypothetical protein [Turicibacter sp.]
MYELLKATLMHLTIEDLILLNIQNDLRIDNRELAYFHHLLTDHWNEVIDESSLSLNSDQLRTHLNTSNISKYNELITNIKRNVIFNKNCNYTKTDQA